jgi:hypothetical protein
VLHKRRQTFYFRARIPHDLVATFGRRELWRSLHTRQRRTARIRAAHLRAKQLSLFEHVRTMQANSTLTPEQIDALVRRYLDDGKAG